MKTGHHFLTIEDDKDKKHYVQKFHYCDDDGDKYILKQTTIYGMVEGMGYVEVNKNPKRISVSEFLCCVDVYMGDARKTFSDEKFVNDFCASYIFDEDVYE